MPGSMCILGTTVSGFAAKSRKQANWTLIELVLCRGRGVVESGSPFGYMFSDRECAKRYFGGIGILLLLYTLMFIMMFIIILPSAVSLASQYANGFYPNASANPFDIPFLGPAAYLIPLVFTFIFGSILGGYFLRIVGNLATGMTTALPRWFDDFGNTIVHGFIITVIYFIWQIPSYIFSALSISGYKFSNGPDGPVLTSLSQSAAIFTILGAIWGIFLLLILPIVVARYSGKYRFAAAFEIGQILTVLRYNIGKYLLVFLLEIVAGIIAALGVIALGVGVLFTGMYAAFVIAGLWGFAYREAVRKVMG
jgi:Protein of unknown function (DUF4013)